MEGFTINVKVGLEESTIQSLGRIFTTCIGGARPAQPQAPAPVEVRTAPQPAAPAPVPEAPAPAAVDNMTLMNAVKAAKDKSGIDAVRALFAKYGIQASRDCPAEKRPDLLSELNALS